LTILAAALATSLADWLFFGVLFHEKYKAFPEIWKRPQGGRGEGKAIGTSAAVSLLTPVTFVCLCAKTGQTGADAFMVAALAWLMVPVPMLITNFLFIKMHALVTTAHTLGWLAKLLLCAAAVAYFL
jgi:hypothetical protein